MAIPLRAKVCLGIYEEFVNSADNKAIDEVASAVPVVGGEPMEILELSVLRLT